MSTLSLSYVLLVLACTAGGAAGAWLVTAMHFRIKLAETGSRLEQAELAKTKAQELALQARAQVESLQQALSEAKRDGAMQGATQAARAAAAAAAAAKAQARADLARQLETADKHDRSPHGFADTQPMAS